MNVALHVILGLLLLLLVVNLKQSEPAGGSNTQMSDQFYSPSQCWSEDSGSNNSKHLLGSSFPDGTVIVCVCCNCSETFKNSKTTAGQNKLSRSP